MKRLSEAQISRIRKLRYGDGLSASATARIMGCSLTPIAMYAPGRPGKVPVAPLREAFLASGLTAVEVARRMGWWDRERADSSRVKRTLGLYPDTTGNPKYRGMRTWRTLVDAEIVGDLAEAIGLMPWEVMPDEGDYTLDMTG